jgi:exopolysaccharide biosynthesis polyprenyl glycosylphosphotransferase
MVNPIPEAQFQVTYVGEIPLVLLPSRLSVLEALTFKRTTQQLFSGSSIPPTVIFDLSQTTFIDSSGIGALISNLKMARQNGSNLVLRGVNSQVMAVFELTSLDQVLTFESWETSPLSHDDHIDSNQLPMTHPSIRSWVKRLMDIVGAIVGLGITAIVFPLVLIAIELDDPGPIFFGQIRCGWMGKRFRIWKFRSMCVNAEALKDQVQNQAEGAIFKNDNDPRVTRVGRFLRRSSLDELPQFWNVLKGEMSLVGTRPSLPDEVERYEIPQWQRFDVKPGMTGEWQVNGRSQVKNFEDVIRLDLKYQENWSLWYDIKLILKTIFILFNKNSGAM